MRLSVGRGRRIVSAKRSLEVFQFMSAFPMYKAPNARGICLIPTLGLIR